MSIFFLMILVIISVFLLKIMFFNKNRVSKNLDISFIDKLCKIPDLIILAFSMISLPFLFFLFSMINKGQGISNNYGIFENIMLSEITAIFILLFFNISAVMLYLKKKYLFSILSCLFPITFELLVTIIFRK